MYGRQQGEFGSERIKENISLEKINLSPGNFFSEKGQNLYSVK